MKNHHKVITARQLRHGQRYQRQHPIGEYIVDFVCLKKKLIIEIDGGHHNLESEITKDESRTKWLESEGYRVIRFWNNDAITNIDGVITRIMQES